jgi:hypothetical protein
MSERSRGLRKGTNRQGVLRSGRPQVPTGGISAGVDISLS